MYSRQTSDQLFQNKIKKLKEGENMPKGLKILAVISSFTMLFVLIGGALVTKTGSGMGCGRSWPLCEGQLIPTNITVELIIELSHRLVSGFATFVVVALAIWSWKRIGHIRETKFLAFLSVFFLVLQALIGAAAVVWGQSPVVMALHFGISLISFAAVFLLTLLIFEVDKKFDAKSLIIDKKMRLQIYLIAIYCYLVVYTGALVRHKKATFACIDFPFCNNEQISLPTTTYEWVQMGHRVAATLFFIWILAFAVKVVRSYKPHSVLFWGAIISVILITLQIVTGITTIFTFSTLYVPLLHALFISCLFGVLSYLLLLASRSKKYEKRNEKKVA